MRTMIRQTRDHSRPHEREALRSEPQEGAPSRRRRTASTHGNDATHTGLHGSSGGFSDAVNAGLGSRHAAGEMIVGRVTMRDRAVGDRAIVQTLLARREVSPAIGFSSHAAATEFAMTHPGSLLAIARMHDNRFRVFETGFVVPRVRGAPGNARPDVQIQVSPISRSGAYEIVGWGNLDLIPRDDDANLGEAALISGESDAFARFERANEAMGHERLTQIRLGLEQVLGTDVELRDAFYQNYTRHSLSIADGNQLSNMERRDQEALTIAGNTTVLPAVFNFSPVRLVGLLMHEMMHGRLNHPSGNQSTGNPILEGQAYAMQYWVVERGNAPRNERDRVLGIIINNRDGVRPDLELTQAQEFNRMYAALTALQQLIDGRFEHSNAPFARMTPARAGELMRELSTNFTPSDDLAAVLAWTSEHLDRFPLLRGEH